MSHKPSAPAIGQIILFTKGSDATGKQFQLKGSLVNFEIYESLCSPSYSSTMNITVLDPDNILYPQIRGNEIILLGFKSAGNKENENYTKVYQTIEAEKFVDEQQRQCVIIYCTTPYNVIGKMVYFSKVFDSTSSKQCLEQVCQILERGFQSYTVDAKYNKNFEDSLFTRPLNVPNRNWEWIIDYWVHNSVAQGKKSYSSLFYFWDDNNGLNFKQNKTLMAEEPKHVLFLMKNNFKPVVQHNIIDRFEVIEQVSTKNQIYNKVVQPFVVNLSTSEFASGQLDQEDKNTDTLKQDQKEYDISNNLFGQSKNRIFVPVNYATEWKLMGSQMNDTTVKTNITNQIHEDTNYTTFAYAEIAGDVTRCPGDLIQLVRLDRDGVIDKNDQSIWMIKSIKHTVTYDKYIQTLEIMK